MHFHPELKRIRRVYQTAVSGSETYDSHTPTLWRKPVSTINTSSASYQTGLSPYEINNKAYGPVVASAIGLVDGVSEAASAVYNFSAESLQALSDSITAVSNSVDSMVNSVSDLASESLQAVEDLGTSVSNTASEVTSAVSDALSSATTTVTDAVSSAASSVGDAASSVGSSISDTASSIATYVTLGAMGTKSLLDTKA